MKKTKTHPSDIYLDFHFSLPLFLCETFYSTQNYPKKEEERYSVPSFLSTYIKSSKEEQVS